jgi:hypothetical protein
MLARVKIERPISEGKWNAATGDYDGTSTELLYVGRARINKVARPTRRAFVADSADNQTVRIQIPMDTYYNEADPAPVDLRWQSNDLVTILANPSNPMMVDEKLFLHGWLGSSNDWLQTLTCGFNAKQDGA